MPTAAPSRSQRPSFSNRPAPSQSTTLQPTTPAGKDASVGQDAEESQVQPEDHHVLKLLSKSKFFQELDPEVKTKLPEIAVAEFKSKGDVVIQQGDVGTHCCIVLAGSVSVWIKMSKKEEEDEHQHDAANTSDEDELSSEDERHSTAAKPHAGPAGGAKPSTNGDRPSSASSPGPQQTAAGGRGSTGDGQQHGHAHHHSTARRSSKRTASKRSPSKTSPRRRSVVDHGHHHGHEEDEAAAHDDGHHHHHHHHHHHRRKHHPPMNSEDGGDLADAIMEVHRQMKLGTKVATLGAGAIFGELALLHEQPRAASIVCEEECEFLIITKADFDALLKTNMMRQKQNKINYLRAHCPGLRHLHRLPAKKVDSILYGFEKVTFPKGHVFFNQNDMAKAAIYIVLAGSVEFRHRAPTVQSTFSRIPVPEVRQLGAIVSGGAFGPLTPGSRESFSAVATSTCETLCSENERHRSLPRSLREAIRKNLAEKMTWRVERCVPSVLVGDKRPATAPALPRSSGRRGSLRQSASLPAGSWRGLSSVPSSPSSLPSSRPPSRPGTPVNGALGGRSRPRTPVSASGGRAVVDLTYVCPSQSSPALMSNAGASRSSSSSTPTHRRSSGSAGSPTSGDGSSPTGSDTGGGTHQTTPPIPARNPLNFSLDLERCRMLGGQRLRAVRNTPPASRTYPALIEHHNLCRLKDALSKSLLVAH